MKNKITSDKTGTTGNYNIHQILTILIFLYFFIYFQHIFPCNPSIEISNLFQTGDLAVLVSLYRLHKIGSVHQTLMGSGIQPCKSLAQQFHIQLFLFQIYFIEVGDFKFASG